MLIDTSRTDTIYARSSGEGRGGVHVFRISGAQAYAIGLALSDLKHIKPRFAHYAKLCDSSSNEVIDSGLIVYFPTPASFTGEDVIEFHLHGSLAVEKAFFASLSKFQGVRPAEPGEFTLRAFLNGKIDLLEAEGLADLIEADTEAERKLALRQSHGELSQTFTSWRSKLIELLALTEAGIDFSEEEDIATETLSLVQKNLSEFIKHLTRSLATEPLSEQIKRGLSVTLSGAPNAGKSSLLNALINRERAIVTPEAGTTRDLIETDLEIEGLKLRLTDGAGLRNAEDTIEAEGIRRAKKANENADLILWLIDPQSPVFPDEVDQKTACNKLWFIINKADLELGAPPLPANLASCPKLTLSALTGDGIENLRQKLRGFCQNHTAPTNDSLFIQARHQQHLSALLSALLSAQATNEMELIAEHLRRSVHHIGKLTGNVSIEDVLDEIFSRFCLGK